MTEWEWKTSIIGQWTWPSAHQGLLESSLFSPKHLASLSTNSDKGRKKGGDRGEVRDVLSCWVRSHPHDRLNTSLGHTDTCTHRLSSFMRIIWEVYMDGLIRSACLQLIWARRGGGILRRCLESNERVGAGPQNEEWLTDISKVYIKQAIATVLLKTFCKNLQVSKIKIVSHSKGYIH